MSLSSTLKKEGLKGVFSGVSGASNGIVLVAGLAGLATAAMSVYAGFQIMSESGTDLNVGKSVGFTIASTAIIVAARTIENFCKDAVHKKIYKIEKNEFLTEYSQYEDDPGVENPTTSEQRKKDIKEGLDDLKYESEPKTTMLSIPYAVAFLTALALGGDAVKDIEFKKDNSEISASEMVLKP